MNWRALIVLPLLTGLSACRATIDISPAQAPCVEGGKVRDLRGQEQAVRETHDVILRPPAGAVFVRAPGSDLLGTVPVYDLPLATDRGLRRVMPEGRRLDELPAGLFRLTGPRGTWHVPAASVGKIEINQFSPGRTAGLLVASGLGGAILTAGAILGIYLVMNPPNFDWDMGGGGWGPMSRPPGAR